MSNYAEWIREDAAALGCVDADVRHIEAWMRLAHPTLDEISREKFCSHVALALRCIDATGSETSEALAKCFRLKITA